jgi:Fur family iron response transcriptional regulator
MTEGRGGRSERTPDGMAAALLAHGITPTRQRTEIAAILLERPQHLSAEQVLVRIRESGRRVSKATVYNTLGLFSRRGLVREVIVDPQRVFYDSNTAAHHHLYEVDTGRLLDIAPAAVSIGALPALPAGTVVEGIDVVVRVRRRGVSPDPDGFDPAGV